ncbi:MAG: ABC transporter substrate-binding protein [Syntrophobacteraceae bacterium]
MKSYFVTGRPAAMAFALLALAFGILVVPCRGAEASPVKIVDDAEHAIELKTPAQRIIPLYGAFAEMLYAIGAGPSVVARTQADDMPPEIVKLPAVGTHMRPNVEMIVGMNPDLVVQSASRRAETPEMEGVTSAGIPIAVFAPETFDAIFSTMERLGVLTGHEDSAKAAVDALKQRLEAVREKVAKAPKRPRVFFEVRTEPLTAAGGGSIVQDVLAAAGAENVVKLDGGVVRYSFEALMKDDPDFYIVQSGPMNRNPSEPGSRAHFDQLRAVRGGKVIFVDELLFSRPGPRAVDAVEQFAAALYPDLFPKSGAQKSP